MAGPVQDLLALAPKLFLAAFLFVTVGLLFLRRMWLHYRLIKAGAKEDRSDRPWERFKGFILYGVFQLKVAREPYAGVLHAFIFWGFMVLGASVLETLMDVFSPGWRLAFFGLEFIARPVLYLSLDVFSMLVLVGVLMAAYRRLVIRPDKLKIGMRAGLLVLAFIAGIVVTLPALNATHILLGTYPVGAQFAPYSAAFAQAMQSWSAEQLRVAQQAFLWSHILMLFSFLAYVPYSKHLHIIMSLPNVYYRDLKPAGALEPIDLEKSTEYGVSRITQFSWKHLLDGYACTECGRCQAACPAHNTGKPLNPKTLVMHTRDLLMHDEKKVLQLAADGGTAATAPAKASEAGEAQASSSTGAAAEGTATEGGEEKKDEIKFTHVVGSVHPEEGLWSCTTCMACVDECPVFIEHVDKIVDMRRNLVLMEGKLPEQAQLALTNMERSYNPWGVPNETRAEWRDGHGGDDLAPLASSSPEASFNVLFWVGCAGSFDDRNKAVTRNFARLMKEAGVKFAILGPEEKCTGDPARLIGNEYLAQTLMKENIQTLGKYKFRRIVTACPHCFNMLKNEYPQFGGDYKVIHHSEFLKELREKGKLKMIPLEVKEEEAKEGAKKATYHDPCYLARYNDLVKESRGLLTNAGYELVEMRRCFRKTFCCGAGGGRMWMEENVGKRVNVERTEEALATGAKTIAVGCPYCMTMLTDGVKAKGLEEKVVVKDIAEIVAERKE